MSRDMHSESTQVLHWECRCGAYQDIAVDRKIAAPGSISDATTCTECGETSVTVLAIVVGGLDDGSFDAKLQELIDAQRKQ